MGTQKSKDGQKVTLKYTPPTTEELAEIFNNWEYVPKLNIIANERFWQEVNEMIKNGNI